MTVVDPRITPFIPIKINDTTYVPPIRIQQIIDTTTHSNGKNATCSVITTGGSNISVKDNALNVVQKITNSLEGNNLDYFA